MAGKRMPFLKGKEAGVAKTKPLSSEAGLMSTRRALRLGRGGGWGGAACVQYSQLALKGNRSHALPWTGTLPFGILPSDLQIINPEAAK